MHSLPVLVVIGVEEAGSTTGGAGGGNVTPASQQQQQDWSAVWEFFENPCSLLLGGGVLSKSMQEAVCNAISEMRRYYSRKVVDVLIRVTRSSLECLRKRFTSEQGGPPVFILQSHLMIPNVVVKPSLEEVQEALIAAGKHISGVAKGVSQWTAGKARQPPSKWTRIGKVEPISNTALTSVVSNLDQETGGKAWPNVSGDAKARRRKMYRLISEDKPSFPLQSRNFFNHVMENKEVMKALSLLSISSQKIKPVITEFLESWSPYKFLWENVMSKKAAHTIGLVEAEASLRRHNELESELNIVPDLYTFRSCLVVSVEKLKFGLLTEIKTCNHRLGNALKKKFHREMDYVYAVINEMDRKLDKPIRDLDDVRLIMETLKKIREQEVDMELKIEPIEVCTNFFLKFFFFFFFFFFLSFFWLLFLYIDKIGIYSHL
ncbi:unnamed protein product [Bemisia tabaci]|uniref:Uncharacterized protein n=1 Tax=Bemisia tabaci TaxID=7038 RepID=A0A9P0C8Q7_BEMTA|nr:unnamed protein product [Bemisia tabaci]